MKLHRWFLRSRRLALALACVAALGPAGIAAAQDIASTPAGAAVADTYGGFLDRVDVEVVNIDVVVTDARRQPVLDLALEDFELLVDGEPVELTHFAPPQRGTGELAAAGTTLSGGEIAPAPVDLAPPAVPPTLIVYIDQTALKHSRRNETMRGISRFLDERYPREGRVMLAVFDQTLHLMTPLTTDRDAVRAALTLAEKKLASGQMARIQEDAAALEIARVDMNDDKLLPEDEALRLGAEIDRRGDEEVSRQRNATRALAGMIGALDGIEGRKLLLLATAGFGTRPAARLGDLWNARFGALDVAPPRSADPLDASATNLQKEFSNLLKAAQAARVTVFAVDGSESSTMSNLDPSLPGVPEVDAPIVASSAELEQTGNLSVLATATGGRMLRSSPQLGEKLQALVDDVDATYSLGFTVGPEVGTGFHRIEVKVRRPKHQVRHREGFRRRETVERIGDAAVAVATFGGADNPLGIDAQVGEPKRKGRTTLVPLVVRVPLRSVTLVPQGAHHSLRVGFHFAIRTADDQLIELESRELAVDIENAKVAAALQQHVSYKVELPLAAGAHEIAVAVHDRIGDGRATLLVPVVVPDRR